MQKQKREAFVSLNNPAAVEAVRAVVREINGFDQPEYKTDTSVKFSFVGDSMDCLKCMQAGAEMVS